MILQTAYRDGSYLDNGQWTVNARWSGRGLAAELGPRAYRLLQAETRVKREGWGWPPGLEMLERLLEERAASQVPE